MLRQLSSQSVSQKLFQRSLPHDIKTYLSDLYPFFGLVKWPYQYQQHVNQITLNDATLKNLVLPILYAVITCRNLFFCLYREHKSSSSQVIFRQAIHRGKRVIEASKLAYATKTQEAIFSQKFCSRDIWRIAKGVLNEGKSAIPPPCHLLLVKQNCPQKTFLSTRILMTEVPLYLLFHLGLVLKYIIFMVHNSQVRNEHKKIIANRDCQRRLFLIVFLQ